jgi:hypothetical protein
MSNVELVLNAIVDHVCVSDIPELIVEYADDGFCYLDDFILSNIPSFMYVYSSRWGGGTTLATKLKKNLTHVTRWIVICNVAEIDVFQGEHTTFINRNDEKAIRNFMNQHGPDVGFIFDNPLYIYSSKNLRDIFNLKCTVIIVGYTRRILGQMDYTFIVRPSFYHMRDFEDLVRDLPHGTYEFARENKDKILVYDDYNDEFKNI